MKSYLDLLKHVFENGQDRGDRTGVGTRSVFGVQMRVDLQQGFPLLTTKKVHFKSVLVELLWFLRGDTNLAFLHEHGVTIWDEWADKRGDLGPVYGKQWRRWNGGNGAGTYDQIGRLVGDLITNPQSRRHIAWNVADVDRMALPPCHTLWQCYVRDSRSNDGPGRPCEKFLDLHLYARSIDIFLGLPFNIASYALLIHILGAYTRLTPGELIISFGDLHLYANHFDQAREQLSRSPSTLPALAMPLRRDLPDGIANLTPAMFAIENYDPQPAIKAPIAV